MTAPGSFKQADVSRLIRGAIKMGPQHIEGGDLMGRDAKTGKAWTLPIAPQLRQAIDAMPKGHHLCFVPSERGRPYSAASFGNMFREWCDDAASSQNEGGTDDGTALASLGQADPAWAPDRLGFSRVAHTRISSPFSRVLYHTNRSRYGV